MKETDKVFEIKRYDLSKDNSLKAYSAADEYLVDDFLSQSTKPKSLAIYHDRFGFLTASLNSFHPITIYTNKSQIEAIKQNQKANNLAKPQFADPLSTLDNKIDFAIMKVPKSLALFEFYLQHIAQNSASEVTVVMAFMTRHFAPRLLEIAQKYYDDVTQSKAIKKARVATLKNKKDSPKQDLIDEINYKNESYKQYWGVFSGKHIDYATQFLIEHIEINSTDNSILDLGAGNGIIVKEVLKHLPNSKIHLMDDFYLAVESAKLNIRGENIHHHFNNEMSIFEDDTFDSIITNPPFHFEYEVNINIPIQLFKECERCLKANGNLQLVANKHLNYITHLKSIFSEVYILAENDKYIVYKCVKTMAD